MAFGGSLTSGSLVDMGPDQGVEGEVVAGRQARHGRTRPCVGSDLLGTADAAPHSH